MIGSSSADIHLRATVELTGAVRVITGDWRMVSTMQTLDV
jgi:beta-glucosidase